MPNIQIQKYRIAVIVLAIAVVGLVIALFIQNGGNAPTAQNLEQYLASSTSGTAATSGTGASANSGASAGTSAGNSAPARSPSVGFTIHLRTPIAGETWTIGQQNAISWDRAAGVSGQIELLNATTKALVGVILPQTGPNQTSYAWNTRNIALSRTNPLKKDVTPGIYQIRLQFDGNNLAPVTSDAFTISSQ